MSDAREVHIACSQCNHTNAVPIPISKYEELVYQPCSDKEGQQDHNKKDQITCENCKNTFDFYWCAGHPIRENVTNARNP